jgi:hypothetical protein
MNMIDWIALYLPGQDAPVLENPEPCGADAVRGYLGNLRIKQTAGGCLCQGSLAKYKQGSNATDLTRQGCQAALSELEKATGWDLRQAVCWGLEIGYTVITEKPVSKYLETWGYVPRTIKTTWGRASLGTVSYSTKARNFKGYDKQAELKKNRQATPQGLQDAFLLRLELKYTKGLSRRLGRQVSPWELTARPLYTELVREWADHYWRIPKGRQVYLNTDAMTPKTLEKSLAAFGVKQAGAGAVYGLIADLQRSGKHDRQRVDRARALVRELETSPEWSFPDELAQELDGKVRGIASYAR